MIHVKDLQAFKAGFAALMGPPRQGEGPTEVLVANIAKQADPAELASAAREALKSKLAGRRVVAVVPIETRDGVRVEVTVEVAG